MAHSIILGHEAGARVAEEMEERALERDDDDDYSMIITSHWPAILSLSVYSTMKHDVSRSGRRKKGREREEEKEKKKMEGTNVFSQFSTGQPVVYGADRNGCNSGLIYDNCLQRARDAPSLFPNETEWLPLTVYYPVGPYIQSRAFFSSSSLL